MRAAKSILLALSLAVVPSCVMGSAQIYSQDQSGGVLVLQGDEADAMKDATARMAAHCGAGAYKVVKRETVVVGAEQYTNSNSGYAATTDRQTTGVAASQSASRVDEHASAEAGAVASQQAVPGGQIAEEHAYVEGDRQVASSSSSASAVAVQEREQQQGQAASSQVSGTREVREARLHYVCVGVN